MQGEFIWKCCFSTFNQGTWSTRMAALGFLPRPVQFAEILFPCSVDHLCSRPDRISAERFVEALIPSEWRLELTPVDVPAFGNRVFADIVKMKSLGGPFFNMIGVLRKEEIQRG